MSARVGDLPVIESINTISTNQQQQTIINKALDSVRSGDEQSQIIDDPRMRSVKISKRLESNYSSEKIRLMDEETKD
jgi:hypothetical protein